MIYDFIFEYYNKLINSMDLPVGMLENLSTAVSSILVYIPVHLLIKSLCGEKIARVGFVSYMVTMIVTLTRVFVGG